MPVPPAENTEYNRAFRARKKAAGLCTYCGKNPIAVGPRGGMTLCASCNEQVRQKKLESLNRHRERRQAAARDRYAALKAAGVCTICKTNPAAEGVHMCAPCTERNRAYARKYRQDGRADYWAKMRGKAIAVYGGACALCGFSDHRALDFHHMNLDGNTRREGQKGGTKGNAESRRIMLHATRHGRLPDIELLCANCHRIQHRPNS